MSLIQAFILGIVQGLTEFLPVSSDGHLTVVPFIIGWDPPTLAFDVALHIGTLAAVAYVFRAEIAVVVRTILRWREADATQRKLVTLLAIGTVPAVIVGGIFSGAIGDAFERPVLAALFLGVTGMFLLSTETKVAAREDLPRHIDDLAARDAAIIGVAQASALLPGISRSGMTIATGMRLGMTREQAARFSFLLAIPVTVGAILLQAPDMLDELGETGAGAFLVGIVTSAAAGFWAIRWLLARLRRGNLRPFGIYLVLMMITGFLTALARG